MGTTRIRGALPSAARPPAAAQEWGPVPAHPRLAGPRIKTALHGAQEEG